MFFKERGGTTLRVILLNGQLSERSSRNSNRLLWNEVNRIGRYSNH